jgi:hypothetical protein
MGAPLLGIGNPIRERDIAAKTRKHCAEFR